MQNLRAIAIAALAISAGWIGLGLLLLPVWVVAAFLIVLAAWFAGTILAAPQNDRR